MKLLIWGGVLTLLGLFGWVVSVVFIVVSFGHLKFLSYIFGLMFILSLPIAGIIALIQRLKDRK